MEKTMNNKTMYTTKKIAEYLGVSSSTIYRMEKRGFIYATRTPGGQRRFSKEIIENYLRKSRNIAAPQNPSKYKRNVQVKEQSAIYTAERNKSIQAIKGKEKEDKPYFEENNITIYNGDVLKINAIKENTVDLIITSPPYNLDIKYNSHNDKMSYDNYLDFTREWLARCLNFMKDDGRFCLNIPLDKNKGGQQSVCADITTIAKQVGWKYHSTIIWNEQNISRRTAWGSWLSASAPYVIAPVETIIILYKNKWKKTSGSKKSDINKKEFMDWTNGMWTFMGASKKRIKHPAPFPVELPRRCIKLFSFVGDTVIDPFLGSGSTLIACIKAKRKGIGIEIDKGYCELAKHRLVTEGEINQLQLVIEGE